MTFFKFRRNKNVRVIKPRSRMDRIWTMLSWACKIGFLVWLYVHLSEILITAILALGVWYGLLPLLRKSRQGARTR